MPWGRGDVARHTKAATTDALKDLWLSVANGALAAGHDDAEAIRMANAMVNKRKRKHMMESVKIEVAEWAPQGMKVNGNVIPGVKVLGFESPSHKRRYPIEAMRQDVGKYEGARVNFDHPEPGRLRPAAAGFGRIRAPRVDEGRGIVGDLHFNPEHPFAKAIAWAAEHDPAQYSLSHLADLEGVREGDWFITKRIDKVHSVDVVSNGGTTTGLFEGAVEGDRTVELTSMSREEIQAARQDLKVLTATESLANDQALKKLQDRVAALEGENTQLKSKVEGFEAEKAKGSRDATRLKAIAEAKLPEHLNTESFRVTCLEASDVQFTALLADRKILADTTTGKISTQPRSGSRSASEGAGVPKPKDAKEFAAFLKGN